MVRMEEGLQATDTEVTVEAGVTVTVAVPKTVESCLELARMVTVPGAVGVKSPVEEMVPIPAGETHQVTAEL